MKIFFNRFPRNEPYGGGNQFLVAMTNDLISRGHEIVYYLVPGIDVIFLMDPRPGDIGYSLEHAIDYLKYSPKTKMLYRVNECDARKGTDFMDNMIIQAMKYSHQVVFISEWLRSQFEDHIKSPAHVIYNGCNTSDFLPDGHELDRTKIKLVTHHWSNNWMKGFDIYTKLDSYLASNSGVPYEFTYIGRYNNLYKPQATHVVNPCSGRRLGEELAQHDVYITASRFEPCGMHHIEGSACGLPLLYHKDGGGINELGFKHGLEYSDFDDMLVKLDDLIKNYDNFVSKIDRQALDIRSVCSKFTSIIEEM